MIFFNLILDRRCIHRYLIYKRSESSIEIYFYFYFCRDITSEILSERPEGSFVVRQSTSRPDCFALSVRVPNGSIAHYLINAVQCTEQSFYRIQVLKNFFSRSNFLQKQNKPVSFVENRPKMCWLSSK